MKGCSIYNSRKNRVYEKICEAGLFLLSNYRLQGIDSLSKDCTGSFDFFGFFEYNQIESLHWDNRNPSAGFF